MKIIMLINDQLVLGNCVLDDIDNCYIEDLEGNIIPNKNIKYFKILCDDDIRLLLR